MPQICKARIVNFHYNNGHRLIPDLCFSFEGEDRKAMDTLISLTNGGGKSVIVQMLLQPILPRVKLDQRRVESYFTRPTDHSFILLEWSLEDSTDRLLTGIAISGRGGEMDEQRGRRVQYYTFLARYGQKGAPEDIVNLPLSTRKKREFQVVPFDFVKEQARKQSSRLQWFREDRQLDYRRQLNSYGISTDEWRNVIAAINQREGGLSNYFEQFKTSSRLIDELLLPCVEKKLKAGAPEGEDSSLETLLLNFARDYAAVEEQVRERDRALELEQELKACSEELQPVHAQCERCEAVQGQMRGFAAQLRRLRSEQLLKQEQAQNALADCEEQARRIAQERSEDQYYQAADESAAALTVLEEAWERWEQSGASVKRIQHRITVLECAQLFEQLTRLDGERNALKETLQALEGDTDLKEQVERLRFTVWTLASDALERTRQEMDALTRERETLRSQVDSLTAEQTKQNRELETARAQFNRLEGAVKHQREGLLRQGEALGSALQIRLDGSVSSKTLEEEATREQQGLNQCQTERESCEEDIRRTEEQLDSLREQSSEAAGNLRELRRDYQRAQESYRVFREQEEALCALLRRYGIDESRCFSDQPRTELRAMLEETRLTIHQRNQQRELLLRQMEAVRRGSLHIPDVVTEFLQNSRISYQTCEEYLKNWKQPDRVETLLQRYPLCAYGVILTDEAFQKLTTDLRPDWLPAAVPVFTYEDLDAMLSGQAEPGPAALACYSERYFADSEGFYDTLEHSADLLEQEANQLRDRVAQMEADLRTVEGFSYPPGHGDRLREHCTSLLEAVDDQASACAALDEEQTAAKVRLNESRKTLRRLEQDLRRQERRVEDYARLSRLAEEYSAALEQLNEAEHQVRSLTRRVNQTQKTLEQRKTELEQTTTLLRDCEGRAGEYQRLCAKTEGAESAPLAEGELEALSAELERLEQKQDSSVNRVRRELERCIADNERTQRELARKKLDKAEYSEVRYSETERDEAEEQCSAAKKLHAERTDTYQTAKDEHTRKKAVEEERRKAVREPLLPREALQYDYERREKALADARDRAGRELREARRVEAQIDRIWERCEEYDRQFAEAEAAEFALDKDFTAQWRGLCRSWEDEARKREQLDQSFRKRLSRDEDHFREDDSFRRLFHSALELLERREQKRSDVYYTLFEQFGHKIEDTQRLIVQLNTELGTLERKRRELEKQFCYEGQQLYTNLKRLAESSRVKVEGRKTAIPMVQINLPEEVDPQVARARITQELHQGLEGLLAQMKQEQLTQVQLMNVVRPLCRSRALLNSYTGQGELEVKVYKVDYNSRNSQYRTWKDTMVGNSGAEKFVSCFAVLVTMMNYTRSLGTALGRGKASSVLILDNPFGAITSAHLLEPMFRIAADFRVQMICLSDISKCDVTECFDSVIKATIKRNAFSNLELLEADNAELVERAFFRAEQVSLF